MATSSTQSGFVDSWQRDKSVTECNLHMLETEDFTDVTFLVGSEKHVVRAHRYVLASRSCVFHAMFCGGMAEQGEITIPDIEVNVFRSFLGYLYTDDVTITSSNVTGMMYTARKYDVETLYEKYAAYLDESLCEENLCDILEEGHGYGETDLEEKAFKMLRRSNCKVVQSPGFLNLCSGCFGTFVKSEHLNLEEAEVFEAALSWTKAECERECLSPSHENMRKILGEMVYEIRFASLSLDFLTKVVGPSEMLKGDERIRMVDRILDSSVDVIPFKAVARQKNDDVSVHHDDGVSYTVHRFMRLVQRYLCCFSRSHSISFSTNKNITLLGCQLFGYTPRSTKLNIQLYDDKNHLISHSVQNADLIPSNTANAVMVPDPVPIQAGRVYTICVDQSPAAGGSLATTVYTGRDGQSRVTEAGVEFTFRESNYGVSSVKNGQIPGLIWRF